MNLNVNNNINKKIFCSLCDSVSHITKQCPSKEDNLCYICGYFHNPKYCSDFFCTRCLKSGHFFQDCINDLNSRKYCFICFSYDHFFEECKKDKLKKSLFEKTRCYSCNKTGHINCKSKLDENNNKEFSESSLNNKSILDRDIECPQCCNCGNMGHYFLDCLEEEMDPELVTQAAYASKFDFCSVCGGKGHMSSFCPDVPKYEKVNVLAFPEKARGVEVAPPRKNAHKVYQRNNETAPLLPGTEFIKVLKVPVPSQSSQFQKNYRDKLINPQKQNYIEPVPQINPSRTFNPNFVKPNFPQFGSRSNFITNQFVPTSNRSNLVRDVHLYRRDFPGQYTVRDHLMFKERVQKSHFSNVPMGRNILLDQKNNQLDNFQLRQMHYGVRNQGFRREVMGLKTNRNISKDEHNQNYNYKWGNKKS